MTYAECATLIRNRIMADSVDTLADDSVFSMFKSVYRQWWKRFSGRTVALAAGSGVNGGTTNTAKMVAGDRTSTIADKDIVDVVSVYVVDMNAAGTISSAALLLLPDAIAAGLVAVEMERVPVEEMRLLYAGYNASTAPAPGMGVVAGRPTLYSIDWRQSDSLSGDTQGWKLTVFPPCDYACCFPMVVRKFPDLVTGTTTLECDDDEAVGLCAVSAMRLLPAVGKQNDSGLVQAIASEVPQEMQSMLFAQKVEDGRVPFTQERPV